MAWQRAPTEGPRFLDAETTAKMQTAGRWLSWLERHPVAKRSGRHRSTSFLSPPLSLNSISHPLG